MRNKIILYFALLLTSFLHGQNTSTSPYSYYGIGEIEGLDQANYSGLGNSTITYFDSTLLNYNNPASYNTMAQGQPIFSTGLSSRLSFYSQNGITNFNKVFVINHFAFGMSLGKHFGVAAGIMPYSRRGYQFYEMKDVSGDLIKHTYTGSGNTNQFFLGFSSDLVNMKKTRLAIGGNVGYLFNSVTNTRTSALTGKDSLTGSSFAKSTALNAITYKLGFYFDQQINEKHQLRIAAVLEPQQKLNATQIDSLSMYVYLSQTVKSYKMLSSDTSTGYFNSAPVFSIGLSHAFRFNDVTKKNNVRNSEIQIHVNYNTTDWTKFSTHFANTTSNIGLYATQKFTLGFQYLPEIASNEKSVNGSIFEKVKYRVGAYAYSLPIRTNNLKITDKGVTLGFNVPILSIRSLSSVNLGLSYGVRGTTDKNLLREKYMGINVGVSFAPAIFERWFVKRKLD